MPASMPVFRLPVLRLPACLSVPRLAGLALAVLGLATLATPARAFDESDLLPVDQAFALTASAPAAGRIQLDWEIADGYYLYKHRISASVERGGFRAEALQLPTGHKKHDEFFGDVETFRGQLQAVLPGAAVAGGGEVLLKVRYQGCADAGVCYPPQTKNVVVHLPGGSGANGSALAPAAPGLPGGLAALGRAPGQSALPGTSPLAGLPAGTDAQPLPQAQAFGFDAIAYDGNTLLMRFIPAPGYYVYRDRTTLKIEGSPGIRPGAPKWPAGDAYRDEHFGAVTVYFEQAEVALPLVREHADAADITLVATFQGCQRDGICYPPMTRRVRLSLPVGIVRHETAAEAATRPRLLKPLAGADANARATPVSAEQAVTVPPPGGRSVPDASADNAFRTPPPTDLPTVGLFGALLLALLGGLILNLMPCVLPILSLKVLGLAQSGESQERARSHATWYTAGVLVAFGCIGLLVIALRSAGQALGWGFQLQHPVFVAALVYLMAAVGLSLSGVFTIGGSVGGLGHQLASRSGRAGDFFTGVLACLVASPCIAPFMGPALAFAFTAPAAVALLVFLALGLGLALPFLLIGFVPALASRLPRPGAWMETLKHVLAFPMYLFAAWLLSVLGRQRGIDAMTYVLGGAIVMALGLWWFERARWRGNASGKVLGVALAVLGLVPVWAITRLPTPEQALAASSAEGAVVFSTKELEALRKAHRIVFVNITADWCITCKANERSVLGNETFRAALKGADAVYMKGDWTNVDPEISAFLDQHKAVGVPLYVVYGRDGHAEVLPTVLSDALVAGALVRAAGRH